MHLGAALPPVNQQLTGVQTQGRRGGGQESTVECAVGTDLPEASEPVCTGQDTYSRHSEHLG